VWRMMNSEVKRKRSECIDWGGASFSKDVSHRNGSTNRCQAWISLFVCIDLNEEVLLTTLGKEAGPHLFMERRERNLHRPQKLSSFPRDLYEMNL